MVMEDAMNANKPALVLSVASIVAVVWLWNGLQQARKELADARSDLADARACEILNQQAREKEAKAVQTLQSSFVDWEIRMDIIRDHLRGLDGFGSSNPRIAIPGMPPVNKLDGITSRLDELEQKVRKAESSVNAIQGDFTRHVMGLPVLGLP
jgi:hypothetical protein